MGTAHSYHRERRHCGGGNRAALRGADADVIAADQARGAILAERPFLSAAVLGEPASSERRAIVRRLRERNVPFLFCGPNPPDAITTSMKHFAVFAIVPVLLTTPSFAADLDGPRYSEREYIEREVSPPRVVEREVATRNIVEHHHYHHRVAPRIYAERIYEEPRAYAYYDRPLRRYSHWRPRHHFWDDAWRHHHRRYW